MSKRPTRSEGTPHDRITRLCDVAEKAIVAAPDYEGEKLILFLDDDAHGRGGIVHRGYDDDAEALTNLFMHLRAMFRAAGKDLQFYPFEAPRG